jgi:general secretion pathway protein E/type IV pilus assembly protein PilB
MPIEPLVATAEINSAIDRFYGKDANSIDELLNDLSVMAAGETAAVTTERGAGVDATNTDADAPIIKLVHGIIPRPSSAAHRTSISSRWRNACGSATGSTAC